MGGKWISLAGMAVAHEVNDGLPVLSVMINLSLPSSCPFGFKSSQHLRDIGPKCDELLNEMSMLRLQTDAS